MYKGPANESPRLVLEGIVAWISQEDESMCG